MIHYATSHDIIHTKSYIPHLWGISHNMLTFSTSIRHLYRILINIVSNFKSVKVPKLTILSCSASTRLTCRFYRIVINFFIEISPFHLSHLSSQVLYWYLGWWSLQQIQSVHVFASSVVVTVQFSNCITFIPDIPHDS